MTAFGVSQDCQGVSPHRRRGCPRELPTRWSSSSSLLLRCAGTRLALSGGDTCLEALSAFGQFWTSRLTHSGPNATRVSPRLSINGGEAKLRATSRSARCVLDRRFEAPCVERRHTLDPPQTLGGVPDGEREHGLRIRGIDDVDEVVVTLRVVDRLYLDAQFVELCLGLLDSLRLLARVLRA